MAKLSLHACGNPAEAAASDFILCPATNGGTSPHTPPLRIRKSDEIEDKKPGQGQPLWTRRSHPPSGDIKAIQYPIDATATRLTTAIPMVTRYYAIQEQRRSPVSPRPTTTRPTVTRTRPTATRRRPIVKGTPAPMATTTTPISATSKTLDSAAFQVSVLKIK